MKTNTNNYKQITIDAGKNALNMKKDLENLKKPLYEFIFTLRKMPEYELKWVLEQEIKPTIRTIIAKLGGE